jgi:DNA polymerase III delta prime subunit
VNAPCVASLLSPSRVAPDVTGCATCGQGTRRRLRFGPSLVEACSHCHALTVDSVVDARVPSFEGHVKALREEIAAEEEEGTGKELVCAVEDAAPAKGGASLQAQVLRGDPRWVVPGSRVEGFLPDAADEADSAYVDVEQRACGVLRLATDDRRWADLRRGAEVRLRPQTNAALYRNLLKAFLVVRRRFPDAYHSLEHPDRLPRLSTQPVPGLDETDLRPSQAKALRAAVRLPEGGILLVQGPPGTGKTTVIARLLREEARRHRTVLVASHTHVAIDNALRKALAATPTLATKAVRLGDSGRVAEDLAHLNRRIGSFRADPEDPDARPLFETLQERHPVAAMTLDALASAILAADQDNQDVRPFDTVIVDEAGMNAFPKTAIAAAVARRLVLVGDPLQLPPIVRGRRASRDENHRRSHFEILQRMRADLAVLLDEQFRCEPAIYEWSKDAIYGGQVRSARPAGKGAWKVLGDKVDGAVAWVDTSGIPGNRSEQRGTSRANPTHVELGIRIAQELLKQGLAPGDVGYITPFRAQAELWRDTVAAGKSRLASLARMTAATVDAFQGNERRAILFDLTTTHPAKPHEDHRRLNVSLTRAQDLLVILGPRPFVRRMEENPFLWSLQNWARPAVLQPTPAMPARRAP